MMANSNLSHRNRSTPLAFFGTAEFSAPALEALLEAGFEVAVVITKPDATSGRGRKIIPPKVKVVAQTHNIAVLQPSTKGELVAALPALTHINNAVVVAYGMILPQVVLDHFTAAIVNVHASLLPRWRGPSPIEAAILHDDPQTGITLMQLEAAMDSGPIYAQSTLPLLNRQETRLSLYDKLSRLGAEILTQELPAILSGDTTPTPQPEDGIAYCPLIKKGDGVIDWELEAGDIERQIRAYLGWPGSRTQIKGVDITITSAQVTTDDGASGDIFTTDKHLLGVYCGGGGLLIERLIPSGRREISGSDFVRGYLKKS